MSSSQSPGRLIGILALSVVVASCAGKGSTSPTAPTPNPTPAPTPTPTPSPSGSTAIYVSGARGSDSNSGDQSSPLRTIQAGIDMAAAKGGGSVRIDGVLLEGDTLSGPKYVESLTLKSNVKLAGGYSPAWQQDPTYLTIVDPPKGEIPVVASGISNAAVENLFLYGASDKGNAIGMLLQSATGIEIRNNIISVSEAQHGVDGASGANGANGARGGNGSNAGGDGVAGPGAGSEVGAGGDGGKGRTGLGDGNPGHSGSDGEHGGFGGAGGAGGNAGSAAGNGHDGLPGGPSGFFAIPAAALGTLSNGTYLPSKAGSGIAGGWGGGGGGGGGGLVLNPITLPSVGSGSSGGGGGSGGLGGEPGGKGTSGYGSFGILMTGLSTATIDGNTIETDGGGDGGAPGDGGAGGPGGAGGHGGASGFLMTAAGDGGAGGQGGPGGAGGGGSGGPSIGIAYSDTDSFTGANDFQIGPGGKARVNAKAPPAVQGSDGVSANTMKIG